MKTILKYLFDYFSGKKWSKTEAKYTPLQSINLNDVVIVRLTKKGEDALRNYHRYGVSDQFLNDHLNEDGTYRFQLHEMMRVFGCHLNVGSVTVIEENTIYLK